MQGPMRFNPRLMLLAAIVGRTAGSLAAEQPPQSDQERPLIQLKIYPAAEPRPALRYRLLPALIDLRPGNAAVLYNRAALIWQQHRDSKQDSQRSGEWLDLPLDKLPRTEMATAVGRWKNVLEQVELASVREECDWQMPIREQVPFTILLPELQELRTLARLVAAKARLEIADGRADEAVATLRTGYAMARHAAHGPTLIHSLVGMAIANMMTNQTRELSQRPDAPNLYWAFAVLPLPFIDLDTAYDFEADSIYFWHPEWRHLESGNRGPEAWRRAYDELVSAMNSLDDRRSHQDHQLEVVVRAVKEYSRAKQWLIERGQSAEAVELMPVQQVVVLYTFGTYNELRDQMFKWSRLPFVEAHGKLLAAEALHQKLAEMHEIVPLAHWLLPAVQASMHAQARNEQLFALARTIEAIRLYAAGHDGRLPDSLADISEVPVPADPWNGQPFAYRRSGDKAVLAGALPPGWSHHAVPTQFEITVAR